MIVVEMFFEGDRCFLTPGALYVNAGVVKVWKSRSIDQFTQAIWKQQGFSPRNQKNQ